ncbi:MAG: rRNA adenine N-6-methyltransferase family protein, partial [Gammaproteobacteria bacterium]
MAHVARKRFGQHFLCDRSVIEAIVSAIDPKAGELLVEIGPGLAALTDALLRRVPALTAIEIDRDLAARLRRRYGDRLELVEADVLEVDLRALAAELAAMTTAQRAEVPGLNRDRADIVAAGAVAIAEVAAAAGVAEL